MPFAKYDLERKWGKVAAGEEITITSVHGDVMIVRNSEGTRFSMHKDLIGYSDEEMIEIKKQIPVGEKTTEIKKSNTRKKANNNSTPTLF